MPAHKTNSSPLAKKPNGTGATLGFEKKLFEMADQMRGHMDPAEYKHVALGLIFLKYISDAFQAARDKIAAEPYADTEDRDEYTARTVFWVPREARWPAIQAVAKQPEIGTVIDDAMLAIERENPRLKGVLPREYARPALNKQRLGELIDLISQVDLIAAGDPTAPDESIPDGTELSAPAESVGAAHRSLDLLGRVYEYFLARFAGAEGKSGGEFYTPRSVVRLLVEITQPFGGRVYDPCCGSGGMFVQSEEFIAHHGGRRDDIAIYGQESNHTTWRLAKMNLAIRGIDADLGKENADTFLSDQHPDLRADVILANPPFNMSYWGAEKLQGDARWHYGTPPAGNANYAWVQHMAYHLSPTGIAGFVLANGSMSSNTSGEGEIRRKMIEADLIDCMIALPPQLFYGTGIPACLWFLAPDKSGARPGASLRPFDQSTIQKPPLRDRRGETLFIDARKLGFLEDRTHRLFSDEDTGRIAGTYHAWRGEPEAGEYADVLGFCKFATLADIATNSYVLTPGRYVGAEDLEDDGEPFAEKMQRLTATLEAQFAEGRRLEDEIRENLASLSNGY